MTTTVTAADNAPKVLISQSGRKGDPGTDGTNGDGFNQVRKSLLDNPLCHLFKTNKLVDTSAPTSTDSDITFTRGSTATYVDRYGIVKTAAVNTPFTQAGSYVSTAVGYNAQFTYVNGPSQTGTIGFTLGTFGTAAGNTGIDMWVVGNSGTPYQCGYSDDSQLYILASYGDVSSDFTLGGTVPCVSSLERRTSPREEKDGFLIEGASTNIIVYSEQFENAAWGKNTVTVTANNVAAPDGTITADKLVGTGADSYVFQGFTAASVLSTASVWLRADVPTSCALIFVGGVTQVKSISLTTEWQRFQINSTDVSNNNFLIGGGGTLGIGVTIYAWGAQIEQSLAATSYIPTVATPVTRIADQALLPVLNNVVTKEFSIFGIISNTSATTTGNKFIFRVPVSSGFLAFFYNPSNNIHYFRYDDNSTEVQTSVIPTENIKYFALTVDGSNITININGAEATATKITDPSLVFNFVSFFGTTGIALSNGNIKDFRIYDFALNANEVEYLSQ
jgi:hypothetical protein